MSVTDVTARVGVLPLDRLGGLVVLIDVAHELAPQICSRGEDAAVDEVALDLGELEIDLVQPRGTCRREVQTHVLVQRQELAHPLGLMRGEVVEDDVNLLVIGCSATTAPRKARTLRWCAGGDRDNHRCSRAFLPVRDRRNS